MTSVAIAEKKKNFIIPGVVGNILEWYDFSLYGYFASIISSLFFPTDNQSIALFKTFGIFAAGFLMRPIGAIIFGHFGDRYGRKKILAVSIILMSGSTFIIGILPTYSQIGVTAGILLTICRLMQGLAVGGEFSGSIVYIIEHSSQTKRGMYGSLTMQSAFTGLFIGSIVGAIVNGLAEGTAYEHMAWRIPFLLGVVLGFIGLYLRLQMPETPGFVKLQEKGTTSKHPLVESLREHPIEILKSTLLVFLPSMSFYLCFVYLSSYFYIYLNLPLTTSLVINSISMVVILLIIPWFGYLSDKIGRKPVLFAGATLICLFSYPLFLLLAKATFASVLTAQICFAILVSLCYSAVPATLVEMVSTKVRYTAMSLPFNLSNALFAGTAPLFATFIINKSNNILAPAFYLIIAGIVMIITVCTIKETYNKQLL